MDTCVEGPTRFPNGRAKVDEESGYRRTSACIPTRETMMVSDHVGTSLQRLLSARTSTLWAGFTGLLCLMAFIAVDAGRMERNVAASSARLRQESRDRDALLDQLRLDIFRAGTIARDYLLEPDDTRAASEKTELESVRVRIEDTLRQYERTLPESEARTLKDLRAHVDSYWQSLAPVLQWNALARRRQGQEYMLTVLLPRRAEIGGLARQVTLLNERDLDSGEVHLQELQSHFRVRVTVVSVVTLLLGGVLAALILHRVRHLEQQADVRYREVEEARRELRNLSDRLVTAQEEERRNLSREVHDEIGQARSALRVDV